MREADEGISFWVNRYLTNGVDAVLSVLNISDVIIIDIFAICCDRKRLYGTIREIIPKPKFGDDISVIFRIDRSPCRSRIRIERENSLFSDGRISHLRSNDDVFVFLQSICENICIHRQIRKDNIYPDRFGATFFETIDCFGKDGLREIEYSNIRLLKSIKRLIIDFNDDDGIRAFSIIFLIEKRGIETQLNRSAQNKIEKQRRYDAHKKNNANIFCIFPNVHIILEKRNIYFDYIRTMENSKRNIMILVGIGLILIASIIAFISFRTGGNNTYQYSVNTGSGDLEVSATGTVKTDTVSMLAYVSELSGNVKKTSVQGAYFLKKSGEVLTIGDVLRTGDDGMATVTFSDNSVIRLNTNSEISFQKLTKDDTVLELKNGEIWARVLKPLYDTSFFTINTGDLSTGVRGTSLSITTRKGKTQLEVVDSFAETEEKRGVTVRYKDPKTSQPIEERIQPKKRLILNTGEIQTILKQDFKADEIYASNFKRQSTQKDIILMDHLQKTSSGSKNLSEKVSGELAITLPK